MTEDTENKPIQTSCDQTTDSKIHVATSSLISRTLLEDASNNQPCELANTSVSWYTAHSSFVCVHGISFTLTQADSKFSTILSECEDRCLCPTEHDLPTSIWELIFSYNGDVDDLEVADHVDDQPGPLPIAGSIEPGQTTQEQLPACAALDDDRMPADDLSPLDSIADGGESIFSIDGENDEDVENIDFLLNAKGNYCDCDLCQPNPQLESEDKAEQGLPHSNAEPLRNNFHHDSDFLYCDCELCNPNLLTNRDTKGLSQPTPNQEAFIVCGEEDEKIIFHDVDAHVFEDLLKFKGEKCNCKTCKDGIESSEEGQIGYTENDHDDNIWVKLEHDRDCVWEGVSEYEVMSQIVDGLAGEDEDAIKGEDETRRGGQASGRNGNNDGDLIKHNNAQLQYRPINPGMTASNNHTSRNHDRITHSPSPKLPVTNHSHPFPTIQFNRHHRPTDIAFDREKNANCLGFRLGVHVAKISQRVLPMHKRIHEICGDVEDGRMGLREWKAWMGRRVVRRSWLRQGRGIDDVEGEGEGSSVVENSGFAVDGTIGLVGTKKDARKTRDARFVAKERATLGRAGGRRRSM